MIKTLRITTVTAAILAAGFFIFSVIFGFRGNERDWQIEEFLHSAGAVESFSETIGQKGSENGGGISPLVKQAGVFALYLNPPEPKTPKKTASANRKSSPRRPERAVSAKFTLIGTSFYPLHPELSLVLIDQPGKGLRWIRQSGKVGHLVIEEVKNGSAVIRDGQKTFEMAAKMPVKINLLKSPPGQNDIPESVLPSSITVGADVAGRGWQPEKVSNPEEEAALALLVSKLQATGADAEDNAATMEKLISTFKSERITEQEANSLGRLGEQLSSEPNQADFNEIEEAELSAEPNDSAEE